jgi:3-hydroxymyristoyl/3-hydroxydecanoyl-(acyl carrier protein) dehydratase
MRWMWIDQILELEPGRRLVAIKNVTLAEEHLHDHFPAAGNLPPLPVMPASLIIEGMAQTAGILVGAARDRCRSFPNQREVTVRGSHFIQEDSPDEIGQAVAAWMTELS